MLKIVKNRGFTLMELLIVVAIMGILAAVGLSSFIFSQQKGRDAQRKSDLSQIAKALEIYYDDFKTYPLSEGGKIKACDDGDGNVTVCNWGEVFKLTVRGAEQIYMAKMPNDPQNSNNYYYVSSDGRSYTLYSTLENNQDKGYEQTGYGADDSGNCTCGEVCRYKLTESGVVFPTRD